MAAIVRITIRSDSQDQLREILHREALDLNCGGARKTPTGEWVVEAYAPQKVATRLRKAGIRVEVDKEFETRLSTQQTEVGAGDRFLGGHIRPHGVGRKE